jgi:pSer/pThr/pTyr-binding forkhead associated (FHA) protein
VEKLHARLVQQGERYYLEDSGSPAGTYVNGQRVKGPTPLKSGDLIRVGKNLLRFSERQKQPVP